MLVGPAAAVVLAVVVDVFKVVAGVVTGLVVVTPPASELTRIRWKLYLPYLFRECTESSSYFGPNSSIPRHMLLHLSIPSRRLDVH